jgi:hypothetical protein
MDTPAIPTEYKNKFQLFFVGMFWNDTPDKIYEEWLEGRIEIRTWGDNYSNDEIRYSTKRTKEWFDFQDKFNGKWLTLDELEAFKKEVVDKFKKSPKS